MVALSKRYVTILVRVPEAYALVKQHRCTRPGFLVLDPDGKVWGSIGISQAKGSPARATAYLTRALEAARPLAPVRNRPKLTLADLAGRSASYTVYEVGKGSQAAALGLKEGDALVSIAGKAIDRVGAARAAIEAAEGAEVPWVFRRGATRYTVRARGSIAGLRFAFSVGPPIAEPKPKPKPKPEPEPKPEPKRYY